MRRASLAALSLASAAGIHAAFAQGVPPIPGVAVVQAPPVPFGFPAAQGPLAPRRATAAADAPGARGARVAPRPPAGQFTGVISQSVQVDSNLDLQDPSPGTSTFADTRIGIGYLRETGTQAFALGLDTGYRALWRAEESFESTFASPTLGTLGYGTEWASGSFNADLSARQTQVDFNRPLSDFTTDDGVILVPDDLNDLAGDTNEQRYDAAFTLALATDSPSSYTFTLAATRFDYSDVSGTRTPRDTIQGDAAWTLQLTPVLSSVLLGSYYYYTADDTEETEIRIGEVDAGVLYEPSETLSIAAGIGYADRTREEIVGGERQTTQDETGPSLRALVRYAFEDFVLNFNGRVSSASPETRFNGAARILYPLPRGNISARVFQRYTGSSTGQEVRITGAGLGYLHEINGVSRLGLDVAYGLQVNQDNPDDPDIDRTDLTATYSYDLTPVITADIGYIFRSRVEDPIDATSNAVFFTIGRSFVTGL